MITPLDIRRVGVALGLTPQADALLANGSRIANLYGLPLTVIHAGVSETESQAYLEEAASRLDIPHEKQIIWNQIDPAAALLEAARKADIDLLVAGAFDGPKVGRRRFLGSVARHLAGRVECSLLLCVEENIAPKMFRRIVVVTDYSKEAALALEHALWVGQMDAAEQIYVVSIYSPFMQARAKAGALGGKSARSLAEEEAMMNAFMAKFSKFDGLLEPRIIQATTGFAACDFVDTIDADLLVLPSKNRPGGHVPPMTDWATQVLPCNLWIVRSGTAWRDARGGAQTASIPKNAVKPNQPYGALGRWVSCSINREHRECAIETPFRPDHR